MFVASNYTINMTGPNYATNIGKSGFMFSGNLYFMAFQKLGSLASFRNPDNGQYEWGISPSGERIYCVGFANKKGKVLLCESEARELVCNLQWLMEKQTLVNFLVKKYNIKIPHLKIEWGSEDRKSYPQVNCVQGIDTAVGYDNIKNVIRNYGK